MECMVPRQRLLYDPRKGCAARPVRIGDLVVGGRPWQGDQPDGMHGAAPAPDIV